MASTRTNILLATGCIAVGVALALALNTGDTGPAKESVNPTLRANNTAKRYHNLQNEETPDEYKGGENYINQRFGHLGDVPEAAVSVDDSGDQYLLIPDVFVGLGANGEKKYLRAIARSRTSDKLVKMDFTDKIDQFPVVRAPNYTPPPVLGRLRSMDTRISPGEELPEELGGGTSEGAWKLPPASGSSN